MPFGQPSLDSCIGWYTNETEVYAVWNGKAWCIRGGSLFDPGYAVSQVRYSDAVEKKHVRYAELPWWFQADRLGAFGWMRKLHRAMTGLDEVHHAHTR